MREVDRIMVEDLGVSLLQMMENAGRAFAELTRIHLAGLHRRRIVVLAGRGRQWLRRGGSPFGGPRYASSLPIPSRLWLRCQPISLRRFAR